MRKESYIKRISSCLSRFVRKEEGMTLPFLGIAFLTIVGFTGLSIDIARIQLVQSRLSFAVDAAGLAAGSTVSTTNLTTEVQKYTQANFPVGYLGASIPAATATTSQDNLIIDIVATTQVPTTFINALGISTVTVTARSQITRETTGLELVMVLDNTGSMGGSNLTALKNAATSLVNILYGSKTTVDHLWIGLVPFSQSVNIGTTYNSWMDQTDPHYINRSSWNWKGCVEARAGTYGTDQNDMTDMLPSAQPFKVYYDINNYWNRNSNCPVKLTPMTSNKSTILTAISSMYAQGATHIPYGLVWGWHMLSPTWRGLWGGEMNTQGLPLDYGTEHMNKAIVLLTDGDNTTYTSTYTAYRMLSEGRINGATSTWNGTQQLNNKLTSLCSVMKNDGIYIYSIVLGSNVSSTARTVMKSCASAENYYFESPSSSQLSSIFNAIADSLASLRVSM